LKIKEQSFIRATWIKAGAKSMLHMRHAATVGREDSHSLRWGRLVHCAILEPIRLASMPRWDGDARRGKAWDVFFEKLAGREYVTATELPQLEVITDATRRALKRLPRVAATEQPIEWRDPLYGRAEARIDAVLDSGGWLDVKTTADIDERAFRSACERYQYRLQFGWYDHGARANGINGCRWVVAVESKPPHATAVYSLPTGYLADGYEDAAKIARHYRACEACNVFPGPYDETIAELQRPEWTMTDTVSMEGIGDE
jgi:hypothetical protein